MHNSVFYIRAGAGGRTVARRAAPVLAACVLAVSALLLAGCGEGGDDDTAANAGSRNAAATASPGSATAGNSGGAAVSGEGSIKADPNPVPAGTGNGRTRISWSTKGDLGRVEVHVSEGGQPETLMAQGSEGSVEAPWIQTGATYEFRLYSEQGGRKRLIDKVQVARAR